MNRKLLPLSILLAVVAVTSASAAVIRQGASYTPTGANFTIVALQGIDAGEPLGQSGLNPQVNNNFEFDPSIGVTYDAGNSHLTDFGLGLYQDASHTTQSTGLRVNYNSAVDSASVTITVEDFDIKLSDGGFNHGKVAPLISILGANNTILHTFSPSDIFPAMVERPTANGHGESDIWDINMGVLLANAHLSSSQQISGFVLAADMANGETANSDPYLLLAIGNGIPVVPEASNYIAGLVAMLIAGVSLRRRKVKA